MDKLMQSKPCFLIGAANSNSGKTTLAIGLMRALKRKGLDIQPFKCGPDYIDTQFHGVASGRQSINLDTFLASENFVKETFLRHSSGADAIVAEGVMGLFDGYEGSRGSSAEIAQLLDIPVVLVVNARSMAYSAAPLIYGFRHFNPKLNLKGVIFNMVGSARHYQMLKTACVDAGVECFGFLPRIADLEVPSRHLGLTLSGYDIIDKFADKAADAVIEGVDLEKLLSMCQKDIEQYEEKPLQSGRKPLKIAIAKDEAFSFIYPDNIESLLHHPHYQVEINYFSPISDDCLPQADLLYLPGGYPELYAEQLSGNISMKQSVRDFALSGGKVFAECGGMIYLSKAIDGAEMCGVLPFECTMENARLTLGYRRLQVGKYDFRGHEFHYSKIKDGNEMQSIAEIKTAAGDTAKVGLYRQQNVIAGYTHIYWAENDLFKLWKE